MEPLQTVYPGFTGGETETLRLRKVFRNCVAGDRQAQGSHLTADIRTRDLKGNRALPPLSIAYEVIPSLRIVYPIGHDRTHDRRKNQKWVHIDLL